MMSQVIADISQGMFEQRFNSSDNKMTHLKVWYDNINRWAELGFILIFRFDIFFDNFSLLKFKVIHRVCWQTAPKQPFSWWDIQRGCKI